MYKFLILQDLISYQMFQGVLHLGPNRAVAYSQERNQISGDVWHGLTLEIDLPYYCCSRSLTKWFNENLETVNELCGRVTSEWDGSNWKGRVEDKEQLDRDLTLLAEDIAEWCSLELGEAEEWLEGCDLTLPFDVLWDELKYIARQHRVLLDRNELLGTYMEKTKDEN